MKSRIVAASFAAAAITAGSLAGAAAADSTTPSTPTQTSTASASSTQTSGTTKASTTPAATTTPETTPAATTDPETTPAATSEQEKLDYTAPKWMQPSSYEEEALKAIAKISVWVTGISTVVGALVVLVGAVPGLQQALKLATKAFL